MSFSVRPLLRTNRSFVAFLPRFTRSSSALSPHENQRLGILIKKLTAAQSSYQIHTFYPAVVSEIKGLQQLNASISRLATRSFLSQHHVNHILGALAKSARPADLQCIDQVLNDMNPVFGIAPTIDTYTLIIQVLVQKASPQTTRRWLWAMPRRPGHFFPTLEHFHLFLEALIENYAESFRFMRNLVAQMHTVNCKPSHETFKILIRAKWSQASAEGKGVHPIIFAALINDMHSWSLPYDPSVARLLYDGYAQRGWIVYAEEIKALYDSRFQTLEGPIEADIKSWGLRLSAAARKHGLGAAMALYNSLQNEGCQLNPHITKAMIRYSRDLDDLKLLRGRLGVQPEPYHYQILIVNCVRTGHTDDALAIYKHVQATGLTPDTPMASILIWALCCTSSRSPTEKEIDQAIEIYRQIAKDFPANDTVTTPDSPSHGPDMNIYTNLLRGLSTATNFTKYTPIFETILEDMEKRGISRDGAEIATSVIVLTMKRASNREKALQAYKKHAHLLTGKGYAAVLHTYCKLSFNDARAPEVPSLIDYFGIVQDMRRAGLQITTEVYTIILHQLGLVAKQIKYKHDDNSRQLCDLLITTTRRTHDLLTLDASLSPDAHVWNQLMDTYQRLGCFGDSYRVWDLMYLTGRFDHIAVSIIIDACGHAGAWHVVKRILTRLFNDGFKLNLHNWNTWIECLCRLQRLNDAVRIVCTEMGEIDPSTQPDTETLTILIKFARKAGQVTEVQERIKKHLPDTWEQLAEEWRVP